MKKSKWLKVTTTVAIAALTHSQTTKTIIQKDYTETEKLISTLLNQDLEKVPNNKDGKPCMWGSPVI